MNKDNISFEEVISSLNQVEKITRELQPILSTVDNKVEYVEGIVGGVRTLTKDVKTCCTAISTLRTVTKALSGIPIIGSVISVISTVLDKAKNVAELMKNVLANLDKTLNVLHDLLHKARIGIEKLSECNKIINNHTPEFVRTIKVINYLIQIVKILVPIVKGGDLEKRLNEAIKKIENIEKEAFTTIQELRNLLDEIEGVIHSIESQYEYIKEKTQDLQNAIKSIGMVVNIINPIGEVFQKIIEAIKPIKWVLEAVVCLIDKILKPVIDKILEITGLKKLLDIFVNKILEYLGIQHIIDMVEDCLTPQILRDKLHQMSDFYNSAFDRWSSFSDSLGDFSPLKNTNLNKMLKELIVSVFNAEFDPEKPCPIPDWPDNPIQKITLVEPELKTTRGMRIRWEEDESQKLLPLYTTILSLREYKYPRAKEIAERAECVLNEVNKIYPEWRNLESNINIMQRATVLPDYFVSEVDAIKIYIGFSLNLLEFLTKLPNMPENTKNTLKEIYRIIQTQLADCDDIIQTIQTLHTRVKDINDNLLKLFDNLPEEEKLSDMLCRMDGWAISLDHLLDGFGLAADHNPNEEQKQRLNGLDFNLSGSATDIIIELGNIEKMVGEIIGTLQKLNDAIVFGVEGLKTIAPEGYLFPAEFVGKMATIAKMLHQLDAIFEPLLLLIEVLVDREETKNNVNPLDVGKNMLIAFKNELTQLTEKTPWIVFIETMLKELSPISQLDNEVRIVSSKLEKEVFGIVKAESQSLHTLILILQELMRDKKSYIFGNEEITNRYFTEEEEKEALSLVESILNN